MKLIDENGKLFGKINIIDLVFLIVIILFILWGIGKFFEKEIYSDIYLKMEICEKNGNKISNCGNVPAYYSDIIMKGDEIFLNGKLSGIVLEKYDFYKNQGNINLLLKLRVLDKNGIYSFNNKQIRLAGNIDIKTKKTSMSGIIINFNKNLSQIQNQFIEKKVIIEIQNQDDYIADKINVGDKEIDHDGYIVAKILAKQVKNTEIEVTTEDGLILLAESPIKKDIILEVKLLSEIKENELFFKGQNIKIGNNINIDLENIDISGTIIDIK